MRSVPADPQQRRPTDSACPFVGREQELQLLVQHTRRPIVEGPSIAVVTGAAGMGRTTLLARLAERLTGHLVITVSGVAADAGRRFAVANRLLGRLHEHGLATHVAPGAGDEAPHTMGQRLLSVLSLAAAAGRPLTVIVDDVQHADAESSLALGFATRRLYAQQVQLVLAVRAPDDSAQDAAVGPIMPARGGVLYVRLGGLGVAEIQALGHAIGMAPLRARDARLIRAHCDGNPRHVTRLLEEMRRDPHVRSGRQPLTLRSLTTTYTEQLAALPAQSRGLMWALAVLDDRYPLSTVARVAGVAQPLHALEPLLAAKLVQWWPADPTTPMRIRTPPLRQAAYDGISPVLRRRLHERAATVLPADRALTHRMLAAQGEPDPALADDLTAAGWRWTAEGNLVRAAQYLLWAADVGAPGEACDRRLLFGISLLQRGGQYEAAAALRDRALRCLPSPLRSCVMARYAMVDGDLATAADLLDSGLAHLEGAPWTPDYRRIAAIGYTWLALLHGWLGDQHQARTAAAHCLAVSPFGRRMDRGTELVYLSACCELDGPFAAHERLTTMAALPTAPNEVDPSDVLLLMLRGHFRVLLGEVADGVADIEAGLVTSRAAGMSDVNDWAHFWAASGHIVLGSWDRAREHAAAALDIVHADGRPHVPIMLAMVAYIEANTGRLAAALEHATAATELADTFTLTADRMLAALATAAVAQAKGDHLGVVEALRPNNSGPRAYRWLWWPMYLDALLELGRVDDAEAGVAAMGLEISGGHRVLTVPWLYLTARIVEAGDPAGAVAAYEAVLRAPATLGHRAWRARAADAHRRLGRSLSDAVTPVAAEGHALADNLTARERAVAGLIADGLTNKAVSGYLGITEKTIEAHLTRVYRKLAVRSRAELRAVLHGRTLRLATPYAGSTGHNP